LFADTCRNFEKDLISYDYYILGEFIILSKEKLKEEIANERLDLCLSAGNLAWWEMDLKTGKVIFNENKVKMLGYSMKEFIDVDYTAFTDLVHPDDYEKTMKAMKDHLEGKKSLYEVDYRIKTKKGDYKWFHDRGSILEKNEKGEPLSVKGIVFDITDLKEKENELQELNNNLEHLIEQKTEELEISNKKLKEEIYENNKTKEYSETTRQNLRNIIDSASELIFSFDMNNRVSIWNKTAEKITGFKQIEVLNRSVNKLEVFDNPDYVIENIALFCVNKGKESIDIFLNTKEGDKRIVRVSGTDIKSPNKECLGALFIGRDITKDIELHNKLLDGNSYIIPDKNNMFSINLIIDLAIDRFKALIITRGNPDQLKRQIKDIKNIKLAFLNREKIKGITNISNSEELKNKIKSFSKTNKKSIILLDGIHYLLSRDSFDEFIQNLYDINDIILQNKSILFIRIDPSILESKQMALIENELQFLPSQKTDDIIIRDVLYDMLKYIHEQNQNNAIVSVKKIMTKFNITYVTVASRLDSLDEKNLIFTKKQGKIRAIFLTENGKRLLNKRKII
jgi:PAS domain S-box-containing protein